MESAFISGFTPFLLWHLLYFLKRLNIDCWYTFFILKFLTRHFFMRAFLVPVLFLFIIMECHICKFQAGTVSKYISHLKFHRNVPNVLYPCPIRTCDQTFQKFASFKTHISRNHMGFSPNRTHNFRMCF